MSQFTPSPGPHRVDPYVVPQSLPPNQAIGPPPAKPRADPLAVIGLGLSVTGIGLVPGAALAVVSLMRGRRTGAGGRGIAVAAIAVAAVWVTLLVGLIALRPTTAVDDPAAAPPSSSARTQGEKIEKIDLKVGDCVRRGAKNGRPDLAVVPCTSPHDSEVIGEFRATGGVAYPGEAAIAEEAGRKCVAFLSTRRRAAELALFYVYPFESDWVLSDKLVQCLAHSEGAPLTAPLARG